MPVIRATARLMNYTMWMCGAEHSCNSVHCSVLFSHDKLDHFVYQISPTAYTNRKSIKTERCVRKYFINWNVIEKMLLLSLLLCDGFFLLSYVIDIEFCTFSLCWVKCFAFVEHRLCLNAVQFFILMYFHPNQFQNEKNWRRAKHSNRISAMHKYNLQIYLSLVMLVVVLF